MRRVLLLPALLCFALAAPAYAGSAGGAAAPGGDGGVSPTTPVREQPPKPRKLTVGVFELSPPTIQPGGEPTVFTFRVDGPGRQVRVRVDLVGADGKVAKRISFGYKRLRRTYRKTWKLLGDELPAGAYTARLVARADDGRKLRRTARASGRSRLKVERPAPDPVSVGSGVFPVKGPYDMGGESARFGHDRGTHHHQGQDIMAASGTPVVAPRSGYVYWRRYQEEGAGHYLVVRGDDGRDYVFMHLRAGSLLVDEQDRVRAGQQIAEVGSTGRSSAPHLHFEIWPDGWYAKGSEPIDPRPDLDAWAAGGA